MVDDLTARIVAEVERPGATRVSIASAYREGIVRMGEVDWPTVNRAILRRYTLSGLESIKRQAWALRRREFQAVRHG